MHSYECLLIKTVVTSGNWQLCKNKSLTFTQPMNPCLTLVSCAPTMIRPTVWPTINSTGRFVT